MQNRILSTGAALKKLIIAFSGWAILLVFAGVLVTAPDRSESWWITPAYLSISGIVLLLALSIIAILAGRRSYPETRFLLIPMIGIAGLTLGQLFAGLMALRLNSPHPLLEPLHLFTSTLILGGAIYLATVAFLPNRHLTNTGLSNASHKFYFRSILLALAGLLLLLTTGAIVAGAQAGLACAGWPLCHGEIFPANFSLAIAINLLHRFSTVVVGVSIAAIILQTRRRYAGHKQLATWSTVLGLLFLAQIAVGGLFSFLNLSQVTGPIHLGLSLAIWSSLIIQAAVCYFTVEATCPEIGSEDEAPIPSTPLSKKEKAIIFFKLTKPWIQLLLLITTITAMVIAAEGLPSISLILYTLLGGFLSAGGASVLNSYVDSDIDRVMSRTSRRATVTGLVSPRETLLFGLALSTLSFLIFAGFVNLFSAILSTIGILYYVFFYTLYLKRSTIHNIIIGGAAGAIPPLVGWTAVTGALDLSAFYLFAIIFFWTPPHTWALALLVKKDYAQARVPMLPVVVGEKETTYQIFLYSILLITLTLLPFTFNMFSWVYLIVAALLGARFIYLAWKLWRNYDKSVSRRLYKFSQAYLALLFLMMAIDRSLF